MRLNDKFTCKCNMCDGEFIPDINGDTYTCDRCLYHLTYGLRFTVMADKPVVKPSWYYITSWGKV